MKRFVVRLVCMRELNSFAKLILLILGAGSLVACSASTAMNNKESKSASERAREENLSLATFGGGCFWCVETVFERLRGVKAVTSGYAGGHQPNPTYKEVCSGTTGHAEVVQIAYDSAEVEFSEILELFWLAHDPTTLNRQGADVGTQYRSIILVHDEAQREAAEASKTQAQAQFRDPIVTEIVPFEVFYAAEDYHQDFFSLNPTQPYCSAVIAPKVRKLEKHIQEINQR